jgi:hypothetical protein
MKDGFLRSAQKSVHFLWSSTLPYFLLIPRSKRTKRTLTERICAKVEWVMVEHFVI